ncbi:MAG: hypothetical protein ACU83P_11055 [Gammaproteobacteria bacterium]
MRNHFLLLCLAAGMLPTTSKAFNAIPPFPEIYGGQTGKWVYTVTGIAASRDPGGLDVAFNCTSMDNKRAILGIEIYDEFGILQNFIYDGNGVFETNKIEATLEDELIKPVDARQGSARIISTTKKLICNAFLMGDDSAQPTMLALPVIKGTTQK